MCGIIAVLQRTSERPTPDLGVVVAAVRAATTALDGITVPERSVIAELGDLGAALTAANGNLGGVPGVLAARQDPSGYADLGRAAEALEAAVTAFDQRLDAAADTLGADVVEDLAEAFLPVRDAAWAIRADRIRTIDAVLALAGADPTQSTIEACTAIQYALSGIDRLEVRGRDSAGIHIFVRNAAVDVSAPEVASELAARALDPLFANRSVRVSPDGVCGFVYKAAAEIGDLGDNTARLRAAIADDTLLHRAIAGAEATVSVVGHTRWASVGIISEPNAHPVNSEVAGVDREPYVIASLNGDIDNYADLAALEHLEFPVGITTDAKVIPALVAKRIDGGTASMDAFRDTVATFEGSVAIALQSAAASDDVFLALRGSGQGLFIGLADDCFIAASEPYGIVEITDRYVRMDGETPGNPDNPGASQGQIVRLTRTGAGELAGITRLAYDGTELPLVADDVQRAQITTRDINRGTYPHFLLKEISESPRSFRKTLRGRLVERDGRLTVDLGPETLPADLDARLRAGAISRVFVIGQGTAAVAGQACARLLDALIARSERRLLVEAIPATELSGFRLDDDLTDTLVVAISQSGTTTDTNRTVDLVRSRGGSVIAIVNRRHSDLTDRADGVMYTSDGRDIEMSVASTKAFYAQVAAGLLLAVALAERIGGAASAPDAALLEGLRGLPVAMETVLRDGRPRIAQAAQRHAPFRRSWAVVGNGPNLIAANELRIKCSELCYKAIACDVIEDKKHIDLSSEPLILVCAAGLSGSTGDDVAKEIAIYRAHKAAPIAIVNAGDDRYRAALEVIEVPEVPSELAFILSAMAGHIWGYEAALAIDATALPLRNARAAIEATVITHEPADARFVELGEALAEPATAFFDTLRTGAYDSVLDADVAVRVASLLRYATGMLPLDAYQIEFGKVGTPAAVIEDLTAALTRGIEALTRSIDTIKHQAKTVTVGISRADESLLTNRLVRETLTTGISRDGLSYRSLRALVALDPAVAEVLGYTRYRIQGDPTSDAAIIEIVDRGGIAMGIPSRVEREPILRGTKRLVADERDVFVGRGRNDGRSVVFVPEVKGTQTVGISLLHVKFHDTVPADVMRGVLQGYRNRYAALKGAVTEVEPSFDDSVLGRIDVIEILTEPVYVLAEHWRT